MNEPTTLVVSSVLPAGNLSMSGCAMNANSSLANIAQGMKATNSASTALRSRSRSSSRCDISVPSASCSGVFRWPWLQAQDGLRPPSDGGVVRSNSPCGLHRQAAAGRGGSAAGADLGRGALATRACGDRGIELFFGRRCAGVGRGRRRRGVLCRRRPGFGSSEVSMSGSTFIFVSKL
jgi:hypothetical protein